MLVSQADTQFVPTHQRQCIAHCDMHRFPLRSGFIAHLARQNRDFRSAANLPTAS
jgi:hypothetical protein